MNATFLALYATFLPWPHIASGWKPALSSCDLPKPVQASFDAGAAVHPFLAISYPGVWNGGCTHRPLAQRGLSCPRQQSLRQAPNFPR